MTTRAEQKEKRRWEILDTALDLFIRRGYTATKIKDIAEGVPMSTGLLFHYFDSKAALYTELVRIGASAPREMAAALQTPEPLAFFTACAQETLHFAVHSSFTAKMFILMSNAYYNEEVPEEARKLAFSADFYRGQAPLIRKGQESGVIRPGDPLALCTAFWTALQGAIQAHALDPGLPLPQPEWIVDIIRAESTKPPASG